MIQQIEKRYMGPRFTAQLTYDLRHSFPWQAPYGPALSWPKAATITEASHPHISSQPKLTAGSKQPEKEITTSIIK